MLEKYTICTSKLCKQLVFLVLGGCTNPYVFGKTPIQVSWSGSVCWWIWRGACMPPS